MEKGAFEESEKHFMQSLGLDPFQGMSYFGITQGRKITSADSSLVHQMERVSERAGVSMSASERRHLAYSLAKAYDDLGDYGRAMEHYRAAHEFSLIVKGSPAFDHVAYAESIDQTIDLYSPKLMESLSGQGFSSDQPIFIVGMMRSGTTLTEQIISSHSQVGAAGEQTFWSTRAHLAIDQKTREFKLSQAVSLAREYCREMARLARKLPPSRSIASRFAERENCSHSKKSHR
jgi:tetratricopeptide (TPR) repeat protein